MVTSMFSAVAGIITEPVGGGYNVGRFIGGPIGFGTGIIGLVHKPEKGTIDLVTQATRGIKNTAKSMYINFSRFVKKVPKPQLADEDDLLTGTTAAQIDESLVDSQDDILIGEESGDQIYISRKALRQQI